MELNRRKFLAAAGLVAASGLVRKAETAGGPPIEEDFQLLMGA